MGNKYYQLGEERAEKVNDLFATIAPRYDLINDLQSFGLHRAWKRRLVRLAAPQPGETALDLCCGTGDIAFSLARFGAGVVGLDFSEPMLAKAEEKSLREAENLRVPRFVQGNAQQIPFPSNHFDIVTVGYGLRNLKNWELGLEEMHRVAKSGGRLLVLDFGKPDNSVWRNLYFCYLRWFVPLFGKVFCRNAEAYAYIFESLRNYPAQRGVAQKLREMECEDVQIINLLGGVMSINYARKSKVAHED